MSEIRTPYEKRDHWMQKVHRTYGSKCHLQDIDNIDRWLESKSGELAALAEFKQDYEIIELYKYKPMITLANNSKIPFYIVVGYKDLGPAYYIIGMNFYAKKIPWLDEPRFWSEVNYIKLLHYIRKIKISPEDLIGKSNKTPGKDTPLPNIKGNYVDHI